jgi:hypothetical protein
MSRVQRIPSPWIIVIAAAAAVATNLAIRTIGGLAGGSFEFTSPTGSAFVDHLTVAGFTIVPLSIGLAIAALLGRWWAWVFTVAMIVAPLLELGSILGMTVPADFDLTSTLTLAACHVALVPVSLLAIGALRARRKAMRSSVDAASAGPVQSESELVAGA